MTEKRCPDCGVMMRLDSFTKEFYCPSCGKDNKEFIPKPFILKISKAQLHKEPVVSDSSADEAVNLVHTGYFIEALEILKKLKIEGKSNSKALLMSVFCGYRVTNTADLLSKTATGPMSIQILLTRPEIGRLAEYQFAKENEYVIHIIEYCMLTLMISGKDINEMRDRLKTLHGKGIRKESTLAGLDEEDEHNSERVRMLREAVNPPEPDLIESLTSAESDFMHSRPLADNLVYCSESESVNMALDILELIFSVGDNDYLDLMRHTRKYNYYLARQEESRPKRPPVQQAPQVKRSRSKKDGSDDAGQNIVISIGNDLADLSPEEMKLRQTELLETLAYEEARILSE